MKAEIPSLGGIARSKSLSKKRRSEIAREAAKARWAKPRPKGQEKWRKALSGLIAVIDWSAVDIANAISIDKNIREITEILGGVK